jgi:hypothetical protein
MSASSLSLIVGKSRMEPGSIIIMRSVIVPDVSTLHLTDV